MSNRKGEEEKTWFRAERFFTVGKEYYFNTREGTEVGPFPDLKAAAARLASLYSMLKEQISEWCLRD